MEQADMLARERRARLAAERLLELKQAELFEANRRLSLHARALSDEIVETRGEKEQLKERTQDALVRLESANTAVMIAQRRLWDSVETIRDGFAVFDSDEVMVAANSAFLAPFDGMDSIGPGIAYDEMLRIAVGEGIVDTGDASGADWIAQMLARWRGETLDDRVIRLWNGVSVRLSDRRGTSGDTVSLAIDMTDRVRYEARLKEARSRAEAANRAKSAFLANMSHEIRTPMNGVVGMADLLAETPLTEEQRLFVDTIKSSGEALLGLINDVLDFSKIEAEKLVLRAEIFDLERCIHEVVLLLQPTVLDRTLDILVDYDLFLPTCFVGDPGRMRQILTNLIGNAVKFTARGHVLIRVVGLAEAQGAGHRLHVSVEDTGIGIAPDMAEHIFGEFNQVDDDRNRRFEGTGLGLAITRRLVRLMGGEIWVDSEPGKGACFGFRVTLPVAEAETPRLEQLPETLCRVLVVDGQEANRQIRTRQIQALGKSVLALRSGADLAANPPGDGDAVVLDAALPDAPDGAAALALRAQGFGGTVVLCASAPPPPDVVAAVDSVLPNPCRRRAFLSALAHRPIRTVAPPAEAGDRQMRILAAEDNRTNRLIFGKMLGALDVELTFAVNGQEAAETFAAAPPDLVFMDISMPEVDGKEATRRIRALEEARGLPRTRIVALTAHALPGDAEEILAAGLDAVLTKPLRKDAILAEIADACPPGCRPPLPSLEAAE